MRYEHKRLIVFCMALFVWPFGLLSWLFLRLFHSQSAFDFSARLLSLIPGKVGQYLRAAYYKMTLTECHSDLLVGFGSFFSHPDVRAGRRVGLGSFTIVGACQIGENVMISSRSSVQAGNRGYLELINGTDSTTNTAASQGMTIGTGCWIGEGAIVLSPIGNNCVVSAGSVVSRPSGDRVIAIGNPARFLKTADPADPNRNNELT